MNAAIAWAALGLGVLLLGGPRRTGPRVVATPRRAGVVAAGCVAVGCVAGGGPAGLVAAAALAPAAGYGVALLAGRVGRAARDPGLPLVLDLAAAALAVGQPLPRALEMAAPAGAAATRDELCRIARLLALGADPEDAWRGASRGVAPLGAAARRSARSGAGLARTLTDLAAQVRAADRAAALARAHRAGVLAMLPLGLCFLPAFVCLGIVPSVAGLLGGVLAA